MFRFDFHQLGAKIMFRFDLVLDPVIIYKRLKSSPWTWFGFILNVIAIRISQGQDQTPAIV